MPRLASHDGLMLHYEDEGAGLPVLCLPGLTRNGADFAALAARLAPEARVIRLDARGRGGSDRDPGLAYDLVTEARDVVALMDHLSLPSSVILGTSRGGLVAMVLATFARDRIAGVLLTDVGPDLGPAGLARIMAHVGIAPAHASLDAAAAALARDNADAFPGVPVARWRDWAAGAWRETPEGLALTYDPRLRDALLAQAAAQKAAQEAGGPPPAGLWPLYDALAGLPLAALRGANSDLLLPETFALMRERRPDMIAAEVPDRGHVPFLDEAESLAAIAALLARVRQGGSP